MTGNIARPMHTRAWGKASSKTRQDILLSKSHRKALSKNGHVVVEAVFLALSDALCNPNDIAHLLQHRVSMNALF